MRCFLNHIENGAYYELILMKNTKNVPGAEIFTKNIYNTIIYDYHKLKITRLTDLDSYGRSRRSYGRSLMLKI